MKKLFFTLVSMLSFFTADACVSCNKEIREGIYGSAFYPNLLLMISPFLVLGLIVAILAWLSNRRYSKKVDLNRGITVLTPVPLTTASMILGIGLGGFLDGIVLHQLLQWHEMLSNKIPTNDYVGKSVNMFWDGIFHGFCFLVALIGVIQLWHLLHRENSNRSGKLFSGGILFGWGLFNIVEGTANHQVLKLHNVFEGAADHDLANYTFLAISIVLLLVGYLLIRSGDKHNQAALIKTA